MIKINDENVTISQTPAAALTPIQASTENETLSPLESPMGKKPCFQESTAVCLSKAASPLHLEPNYRDTELVGYTWPLSPISGRNGPKESTTWTYHPMCTVYHAASAAGRDLIYASCCTGTCHVDLIKKYLSRN